MNIETNPIVADIRRNPIDNRATVFFDIAAEHADDHLSPIVVAQSWHGGQTSMLYDYGSAGMLRHPRRSDLSDETMADMASSLAYECWQCVRTIESGLVESSAQDDAGTLRALAIAADKVAAELDPETYS